MTTTQQAVTQYVRFRQATGTDFRSTARLLNAFCRTVGPDIDITEVSPECVQAFIDGHGPLTRYWHRKRSALAGFYRYAASHRLVEQVPLPSFIPKPPPSLVPYLFTREEIRRLLDATSYYHTGRTRLEPHTFRALLLLLYGLAAWRSAPFGACRRRSRDGPADHPRHKILQDAVGTARSRSVWEHASVCGATAQTSCSTGSRFGVPRRLPWRTVAGPYGPPRFRSAS